MIGARKKDLYRIKTGKFMPRTSGVLGWKRREEFSCIVLVTAAPNVCLTLSRLIVE